tara:strand:- start:3705 stop:4340 length:636 start_codon:yes stop_codon:yes gene_type:complete
MAYGNKLGNLQGGMSPSGTDPWAKRPADAIGPWSAPVVGIPGSGSYNKKTVYKQPAQKQQQQQPKPNPLSGELNNLMAKLRGNGNGSLAKVDPKITTGPIWNQGQVNTATQGLRNTPMMMPNISSKYLTPAQQASLQTQNQSATSAAGNQSAISSGRDIAFANSQHDLASNRAYTGAEQAWANNNLQDYGSRMATDAARNSILTSLLGSLV